MPQRIKPGLWHLPIEPSEVPRRGAEREPLSWLLQVPFPIRNLLRRWRELIGMMVGVGIALAMGMAMLAVSNATVELFTADFRRSGVDYYLVTQGGSLVGILPGEGPGTISRGRQVLERVRALPQVRSALGAISLPLEREMPGPRRADAPTELVSALAVEGDPTAIPGLLDLKQGHWLRNTKQVMIGSRLARERRLAPGDTLRLAGRDFSVVGIGKLRGMGLATDGLAYLDARAFGSGAGPGDVFNVIVVDADRPDLARPGLERLQGLDVFAPDDLVSRAQEANETAIVIRLLFGVLTMSIAGLFVSNMLGRAVAERRLEFATLRAIGVPTRSILLTVGGEAVLISLVAGALGIAIASLLGWLMNTYLAPVYSLEFLYSASVGTYALVFAVSLGLGLAAGVLPARQATRVDPADVLREA